MTIDLDSIAQQIPEINSRASEAAKSAMGMQAGAKTMQAAAQPGADIRQVAQQTAAQTTRAAGAADVQAQRASQKQLQQVGQLGVDQLRKTTAAQLQQQEQLQTQQLAAESRRLNLNITTQEIASTRAITKADRVMSEKLANMGIERDNSIQFATLRQREQLAALGRNVKSNILDSRLNFERDEMGRKFTNDRQLEDAAILSATSENELRSRMDIIERTHKRKSQLNQLAHKAATDVLRRGYMREKGDLDHKQLLRLGKIAHEAKKKMQREASAKKARYAKYSAALKVGVAAAIIVGTGGAAAPLAAAAYGVGAAGTTAAVLNNLK